MQALSVVFKNTGTSSSSTRDGDNEGMEAESDTPEILEGIGEVDKVPENPTGTHTVTNI